MLPNAFIGMTKPPTDAELADALGGAKALWDKLLGTLADAHGLTVQEWNSYSPRAGWSLRLKSQKRNIIHLGPSPGAFRVAFVLGDRAVAAARQGGLPRRAIKILEAAPRYPEGTGIRLEIKTAKDIAMVEQLAAIKLAH